MRAKASRRRYIFFLSRTTVEAARISVSYLQDIGIRVLNRQGSTALMAMATPDQVEQASQTGLFSIISAEGIKAEHLEKLSQEHNTIAAFWNTLQSSEYHKMKADRSQMGKSWASEDKEPEPPHALYEPEEFKQALLKDLEVSEKELLKKYKVKKRVPLRGEAFVKYEQQLAENYKDPTIAYHLARIAYHLDPAYQDVLLSLQQSFLDRFFAESAYWKMENEISVGLVFVESSQQGGPKFSTSERNTLQGRIVDGLDWLALQAPTLAHLTWVYDWQFVTINVADGSDTSTEDYWRNPAMGQVSYQGHTYAADWSGVGNYREDMRHHNNSSHAIAIFVTPYANNWHAYAGGGRATLAKRNNWGGWGISTTNMITAHEVCHLFGAADEYTGSGTPCSTCDSTHGCYNIPNGNCGSCARPQQECVMDANNDRLCAYTQGHIGWADLFVELTTGDVNGAGTNDDVWLDIGDRTFYLDTPNHDDRERSNREGYALNYSGVIRSDVKRAGVRKSPDGYHGGWYLKRVRVRVGAELICDQDNINQWLEDEHCWWVCGTCGSSTDIVNSLRVKVTTADAVKAGTDDDVTIFIGGRSWNLDNPGHNDFEQGHTDTFDIDPGTSLYCSMINSVRIHKSPDSDSGGWKLKGLQILVNGTSIYNNQNINKWLEDNDRDWFGVIT